MHLCELAVVARRQVLPSVQLKVTVALREKLSHQPVHSGEIIFIHTEYTCRRSHIFQHTSRCLLLELSEVSEDILYVRLKIVRVNK